MFALGFLCVTLSKHAYKYCSLVCTRSSHSQSHILFAGLPQEASVRPLILADSIHLLKEKKKKEKRSGIGSPDWHVSMFDIHPRRLLWMYCPGHAAGKGNGRADRLAGKITFTSGLRIGRYEVLRSLRHYLRAEDITPSIACRREAFTPYKA